MELDSSRKELVDALRRVVEHTSTRNDDYDSVSAAESVLAKYEAPPVPGGIEPASPLPWGIHHGTQLVDAHGQKFIVNGKAGAAEDRRYIVHACNLHHEFVRVLTELFKQCAIVQRYWGTSYNQKQADAARMGGLDLLVRCGVSPDQWDGQ